MGSRQADEMTAHITVFEDPDDEVLQSTGLLLGACTGTKKGSKAWDQGQCACISQPALWFVETLNVSCIPCSHESLLS